MNQINQRKGTADSTSLYFIRFYGGKLLPLNPLDKGQALVAVSRASEAITPKISPKKLIWKS